MYNIKTATCTRRRGKAANQSRIKLVRLLEVERDTTESQQERVDGCCIPDVKWQWAPDRRPKRENAQSPPVLHLQGGSGRRRMPVQEWSDQGGEYSCRRSERQAGVEEITALKQRHATTRNSSVSGQPVGLTEYRCDVFTKMYWLQTEL